MEGNGRIKKIEEREMGLSQVDGGRGLEREVTRMVLYLCVTPFSFLCFFFFLFFFSVVSANVPIGILLLISQRNNIYCSNKSLLLGLQP